MDLNKTGQFISALRKKKDMTQKELAERIGVTDKAVSRWETGKGFPDVSLLTSIAEILEVSVSEIVMGEKIEIEENKAVEIMDKMNQTVIDALDYSQREISKTNWKRVAAFSLLILLSGSIMFFGFMLVYENIVLFWVDIPSRYVMYMVLVFIAIPIGTPIIINASKNRCPWITPRKTFWISLLMALVLILIATAFLYPEFYRSLVNFELLCYDFNDTAVYEVLFDIMPISLIITLSMTTICYVVNHLKKDRT